MSWLKKITTTHATSLIKQASTPLFDSCNFRGGTTININQGTAGYHTGDDPSNVYSTTIRNNDRYGSDTQRIWIMRTANQNGLSIALEVKAERDGMLSYSDYWHYPTKNESDRDAAFEGLIKISANIKDQIENDHLPVAMIATLFRTATRQLDLPYKEKSGVAAFNDSLEVNTEMDWRKSLYGERYPEVGNSGSLRETWTALNTGDQSREIQTKGKSRGKIHSYKY
jgi:hypothetical protein